MNPNNFNQAKKSISSGVNPVQSEARRQHAGVGYVVLSREVVRNEYVENCYRNNALTIRTDKGEIIKNCFVDKNAWQHIKFPTTNQDVGSSVVWLNIPTLNRCVIVAVLNKKNEVLESVSENTISIGGTSDAGLARLLVDKDLGIISLFTNSSLEGSGFNIKILNEDFMGLLKAHVQGDIVFEAEGVLSVNTTKSIELCVSDDTIDDKSTTVKVVKGEGIYVNDEFGNIIEITSAGVKVIDIQNNQINLNKDGTTVSDDFGNTVKLDTNGITEYVKDYNKGINLVSKANENDKTEATLYKPLEKVLQDALNNQKQICNLLSTLTVVVNTGVINPALGQQFSQLSTQIEQQEQNIQNIKSKTVKLT